MNLPFAQRRLREAHTNLESCNAVLARALTTEDAKKRAAEAAIAADQEADVSEAIQLAAARRDAESVLGAATRNIAAARRAQAAAAAELNAAQFAARQAAFAIIAVEAGQLAKEYARAKLELDAMKIRLDALFDMPGFNPPVELGEMIENDLHTPVDRIPARGDLDLPTNQIAREQALMVRAAEAINYWESRVSDLLRDEPAAQDAAAA